MEALAIVLMIIVMLWVICGAMFAFLGLMARQGLAAGSSHRVQELTMRQERWAGRAAKLMFRRLWPIPILALAGFILIAVNYPI